MHIHSWHKKDNPYVWVFKSYRHINSVTANTLFHKVKFRLRKAFLIMFEMATTTKKLFVYRNGQKVWHQDKPVEIFIN